MSTTFSSADTQSTDSVQQRLAKLTPKQRDILLKKLRNKSPARPAINCSGHAENSAAPLSSHQQRLWLIEQLKPGSPLYNVTRAVRLRGNLQCHALTTALQKIVQRHGALRTVFRPGNGEPQQQVLPEPQLTLKLIDVSTGSELRNKLCEEGRQSFDLFHGLPFRAVLYRLADDNHVLQITIHHLVCDGWSLRLLFSELSALYQSLCTGSQLSLTAPALRYSDFARWQQQPEQQRHIKQQIEWWHQQLAGAPTRLNLAEDLQRPKQPSGNGDLTPFDLQPALTKRLESLGHQHNATLYIVLLTAFAILLRRYTGMDDFLVGAVVAGRQRSETHSVFGFFVDTVALRIDFSDNPSLAQLLRRVRHTLLEAIAHSDAPFEQVVASLDVPPDSSRHPLIQALFNAPPQYPLEMHGLQTTPLHVDLKYARFDLELTYSDGANRQSGITSSSDLFTPETIACMVSQYHTLLNAMAADVTGVRLAEGLPLHDESEQRRLLIDINATARDYPRESGLAALFQRQVERTPDATALLHGEITLTYRELDQQAGQLAKHLHRLHPGERLIALCLPRGCEQIVATLAVLRAGAAYLPLDPEYPPARLAKVLEDSKTTVVISQPGFYDRLPATCQVISCEERNTDSSLLPAINNRDAEQLVCVMYTSGSTGEPKGIAVPQHAVARLVINSNYVRLGEDDCVAHLSNVAFDAAVFEIWGALLNGSSLAIGDREILLDAPQLATFLSHNRVTTAFLTTALFNRYSAIAPEIFADLRQLLFGGELSDPASVHRILAHRPPQRLLHVYGPTENTTFTTWWQVNTLPDNSAVVPIGRPVSNTSVYLLDDRLEPVPTGVPGELYIGGDGLSSGYLHRPELNAESFIDNPFHAGTKLYRSGDLCRWRADGTLEFIGRNDGQIKLRGHRIEPSEIESALCCHPLIDAAAVTVRDDSGERFLFAVIVTNSNATRQTPLPVARLREFLSQSLPDYMLPAMLLEVDRLPLNNNGKVDRKALAQLPLPQQDRQPSVTPARGTDLQQRMLELWQQVLKTNDVNLDSSFFSAGGNSLQAIELISRTSEIFGVQLPVSTLLETRTAKEFASRIQNQTSPATLVTLANAEPDAPRLLCLCGLFLYRELALALGPGVRTYGLHLDVESELLAGRCGDQPGPDVEYMARRYLQEIRKIQPGGDYHIAGLSFGGTIAFEVARQLRAQGEHVVSVALFDSHAPGRRGESMANKAMHHIRQLRKKGTGYVLEYGHHKLRRATRNKPAADADRTLMHDTFKAAQRNYAPKPYQGNALLFRADQAHLFSPHAPDLGWQSYVHGTLDIVDVPGDHTGILRDPGVGIIADKLRGQLLAN